MRAIAVRLALERIGRPEMSGAGNDDAAHEKSGLGERGEERAGLGRRIDDVVVGAVDEQKAQLIVIDGRVTDRRGVEIDAAVLHRRRAEEFFDDLVVRARRQIMRPLRMHVIDAVEADHAFDVGGNVGVGVVAIGGIELIAGQRHQRSEMGAGGIANKPDAIRIEIEFGGLGADELDRGFDVVNRGRIDAGLSQPIVDGKHRIAGAGEEQAPIAIELLVADLPTAAMHGHQNRHLAAAFGQIKIADQLGAVVLGKNQVGMIHDLILRRRSVSGREQHRQRRHEGELGEHGCGLRRSTREFKR